MMTSKTFTNKKEKISSDIIEETVADNGTKNLKKTKTKKAPKVAKKLKEAKIAFRAAKKTFLEAKTKYKIDESDKDAKKRFMMARKSFRTCKKALATAKEVKTDRKKRKISPDIIEKTIADNATEILEERNNNKKSKVTKKVKEAKIVFIAAKKIFLEAKAKYNIDKSDKDARKEFISARKAFRKSKNALTTAKEIIRKTVTDNDAEVLQKTNNKKRKISSDIFEEIVTNNGTKNLKNTNNNNKTKLNVIGSQLFIGNLNRFAVDEEKIISFFKDCGKIVDLTCPKYQDTGKFKGFCFISFETQEGADKAKEKNGEDFLGQPIKINKKKLKKKEEEWVSRKLWMANVSKNNNGSAIPEMEWKKYMKQVRKQRNSR